MKRIFDFRDRSEITLKMTSYWLDNFVQNNYTRDSDHLFILSFYFPFVIQVKYFSSQRSRFVVGSSWERSSS